MIKILTFVFLLISSIGYSQKADCDIKIDILKKVFTSHEIKTFKTTRVFETFVWNTHATIPLNNCYVISFDNGIKAIAFSIYLSKNPTEYELMIKEGIFNMMDVDEKTKFKGGDQRLIQVIFYNTITNKFLGKPKGFPLANFSWIPNGMGDLMEINQINSFKKSKASKNTCILKIDECPDCLGGLNYVLKYHDNKIHASDKIRNCIYSIYEKNKKLIVKLVTNCYETEYDNASPVLKEETLFSW